MIFGGGASSSSRAFECGGLKWDEWANKMHSFFVFLIRKCTAFERERERERERNNVKERLKFLWERKRERIEEAAH